MTASAGLQLGVAQASQKQEYGNYLRLPVVLTSERIFRDASGKIGLVYRATRLHRAM
jgi:hypothetical protein